MIENKKKVIAQYEAIRRSGLTNMFDKNMVQRIAYENEFYTLVTAIADNYGSILSHYSEWIKLVDEKDIPEVRPIEAVWRLR